MKSPSISALVTNCSSLKSAEPSRGLAFGDLVPGPQDSVATQWLARVRAAPANHRTEALYTGRGFLRLKRLAHRLEVPLFVVSAGLGLLRPDTRIPSYNMSVSSSTPAALQKRVVGVFSAKDWWASIQQSPYATSVDEMFAGPVKGLVLIALSSAYVPLVMHDLNRLDDEERARLRLFGASETKYPAELRAMLLPYDARLDRVVRGSKVDFAQRAAEHFVSACEASDQFPTTLATQRDWVEAELSKVVARETPKRRSVDDDEIRRLASKFAAQGVGQSRALAILRHEQGIACEQSRFRRLFLEVTR